MIFTETPLAGAYVIDLDPLHDSRGFFARTWCEEEFEAMGLNARIAQCSVSYNRRRGTLRGMHYQVRPHEETKLVRCTAGSIRDVIIDLRPDSPTLHMWTAVTLSAANRKSVFIPEGVAHGFQTLEDETEVMYQMSEHNSPGAARGIRWNDPAFQIKWPLPVSALSETDSAFADFAPTAPLATSVL
ncbi:MAG TPA: dTDP-4-dehydrorhamnose 3,5-epimerase [Chloroflexota bacterium]|jgi:dTDP-4-dehydrorhamnose 3,5-epimerase|nr:dTDP-4-dehydrorhamnose 3,5-epimerase [Chloroflexota bacterium]